MSIQWSGSQSETLPATQERMESVVEPQVWYDNMCGALAMEGAGIEGSQIKLEDR